MICFCVSSSTSFPLGARAMKSTSATWRSSFRIRSPPRSPSTNAVSARSLERRRQDRGLDLIQRGRDQDRPFAPSFLALDVHLDSADAAALLQVTQVQFLAEEPFRLAKHGPYDVGFLDNPFRLQAGLDEIFSRTRIDVHVRTCPG